MKHVKWKFIEHSQADHICDNPLCKQVIPKGDPVKRRSSGAWKYYHTGRCPKKEE